jgi:hypothetical protein
LPFETVPLEQHMKFRPMILLIILFTTSAFVFAQKRGLRSVDFKNYDYGTLCGGAHKFLALNDDRLALRNGHAEQGDASNYTDLSSVNYIDLDGDGGEEAFVVINGETSGSSGGYQAAYVFGFKGGKIKQLWTKCEENSTAELKGRSIVFVSPEWIGDDAHCCFRSIKTETFGVRSGKVMVTSTTRRRTDSAAVDKNETTEEMAAKFAEAFKEGDLGRLDKEKPYRRTVSFILYDSLNPIVHRKSFSNLKRGTDWLKRGLSEINFVNPELEHCRKGTCTFKDAGGLLHNSLYLLDFTYTTLKGRHFIRTISVLDGD